MVKMAFFRVQGNKILILHSQRKEKTIKQINLHVFNSFSEAQEIVQSEKKWNLLCDSLRMSFPFKFKIQKDKLKHDLIKIIKKREGKTNSDPLNIQILKLNSILNAFSEPLLPYQIKSLKNAKQNLETLKSLVDLNLKRLIKKEEQMQFSESISKQNKSAEDYLEDGLDHYERGEWDQAKTIFLKGLMVESLNVDLLVHAGLSELIDNNNRLALNYFDMAFKIGKSEIDIKIEKEPDEYIKYEDFEKWADNQICDYADECPDWNTDRCDDCDSNPITAFNSLYSYLQFRPFFRAMTNKASTLMRIKRYQEAIETLSICQEYQPLWGTYNMIGECYLGLGNIEEADKWYKEMLWSEAYYIKSLILFLLNKKEEALSNLLTGVTHNWHIAYMLVGLEKPEMIRYIGPTLHSRISASEFIHDHGYHFKSDRSFKFLVRSVLEDPEVNELLIELAEEERKQKEITDYRMSSYHWELINGKLNHQFLSGHVHRLLKKINDKKNK